MLGFFKKSTPIIKNKVLMLIEVLVFVILITVLIAVFFVGLNPYKRFQDARDARRLVDVTVISSAIADYQVAHSGFYLPAIVATTVGNVYMIGAEKNKCDSYNDFCDTAVTSNTSCVNLSDLISAGNTRVMPISPKGASAWTAGHTGYTLQRATTGQLIIRACESEDRGEIGVAR
ncbi:MAG: hypothetical protein Q8M83_04170 [bacterium]|nr:hypothetical protein [bacterium]